jgi:hypothetical protein
MLTRVRFARVAKSIPSATTMAAAVLYTDDTWVSQNGKHSAKPLNITLGNFSADVLRLSSSKRTILHFPAMEASKAVKKTSAYRHERNLMYHHVLHEVLLYLQEAQDNGGVLLFSASHSAAVKYNAAYYAHSNACLLMITRLNS